MGRNTKRKSKGGSRTPSDSEDDESKRRTRSTSKNKNIKFDELDFSNQRSSSTGKSPAKKRARKSDNSDQVSINDDNTISNTDSGSINNNAIASELRNFLDNANTNDKHIETLDLENGKNFSEIEALDLAKFNKLIAVKKVPMEIGVEVLASEGTEFSGSSDEEEMSQTNRQKRVPGNQFVDRTELSRPGTSTTQATAEAPEVMPGLKQMETMAKFFSQFNQNSDMMNFMGQMANFSKALSTFSEKPEATNKEDTDTRKVVKKSTPKKTQRLQDELATPLGKETNGEIQKSPSVDTIYVRALKKKQPVQQATMIAPPQLSDEVQNKLNTEQIVADYLNKIRIADTVDTPDKMVKSVVQKVDRAEPKTVETPDDGAKVVRRAILEAEKFKATVEAPKGKVPEVSYDSANIDARYCTVTSHIEGQAKSKIEMGQFIEIIKLAPKTIAFQAEIKTDNRSVDILNKDGHTFLVQGNQKEERIKNVRKWEECFRVYASIYAEANPHRGAEIWKYVDTINNAASNFHWDNVAHYDHHFRQLMGQFPQRSWAHINVELWTKSMKDPFPSKKFGDQRGQYNNNSNNQKGGSWKDNCCWKFNKSVCTRNPCNFEHRCTFCGSYSHPSMNCYRKNQRSGDKSRSDKRRSVSPDGNKRHKKHHKGSGGGDRRDN